MSPQSAQTNALPGGAAIWHRVACSAYGADLRHLERLCTGAGSILDLGCGTGRVALHLARLGAPITAVDHDPALIAELERDAGLRGAPIRALVGDATALPADLGRFDRILAPMQFMQILGGVEGRAALLGAVDDLLAPGGLFVTSLIETAHLPPVLRDDPAGRISPAPEDRPLPDCVEDDGWLYASVPVTIARGNGSIWVESLRQAVSPQGELTEALHLQEIELLDAAELEAEARPFGLRVRETVAIEQTDAHSGSTIVVFEHDGEGSG